MRRATGLALAVVLTAAPAPARAFDLLEDTYLIDVRQGSKLSDAVAAMRYGGYELSDGTPVAFDPWYRSRWTEMRFDFMTQVSKGVGVLWGFSTGEKGQKYEIRPGLKIGVILQAEPTPQSAFAILATRIFNGRLVEKPCTADYGAIGGVQTVNCRLAATALDPAETLPYLMRAKTPDHTYIGLKFRLTY